MNPSPKDRRLGRVVLGDSAGFELGGAHAEIGLRKAFEEEDGAPQASDEPCAPPELKGFEDSGAVFSVLGVGVCLPLETRHPFTHLAWRSMG
jgi:hypothetical protein